MFSVTGIFPGPCTAASCASAASTPAPAMSGTAADTPEIFRKSRRETPCSSGTWDEESFADEEGVFEDGCFDEDFFFLPSGRSSTGLPPVLADAEQYAPSQDGGIIALDSRFHL